MKLCCDVMDISYDVINFMTMLVIKTSKNSIKAERITNHVLKRNFFFFSDTTKIAEFYVKLLIST